MNFALIIVLCIMFGILIMMCFERVAKHFRKIDAKIDAIINPSSAEREQWEHERQAARRQEAIEQIDAELLKRWTTGAYTDAKPLQCPRTIDHPMHLWRTKHVLVKCAGLPVVHLDVKL